MKSKRTPGPWELNPDIVETVEIIGPNGETIADVWNIAKMLAGERDANAEFIVRACNAHDALVRALKDLKEDLENNGEIFKTDQKRIDIIQYALRLAEGKDGEK